MTRFDYIEYDELSQKQSAQAKDLSRAFEIFLNSIDDSREKALAITKLEECFMWTGKAIRTDQLKRNQTK